jgi:hypothetical protein
MHDQPVPIRVPMTWSTRLLLIAMAGVLLAMVGNLLIALVREGLGLFVLLCAAFVAFCFRCREQVARARREWLAAQRRAGSICKFARRFDCREFDTWILRATYEQMTNYVGFSVRPEDRLTEDLAIDSDDLDYLAEEIARLAGRDFVAVENNPWFGRVDTVADLCDFLMCQPRVSTAA